MGVARIPGQPHRLAPAPPDGPQGAHQVSMLVVATPAFVVRLRCSLCRGRRSRVGRDGPPFCPRCGRSLEPRRHHRLQALALLVAAGTVLGAAVPDLLRGTASLTVRPPLLPLAALERFAPPPDPERQPLTLLRGDLFDRLAEGDRHWEPSVEYLPDGSSSYRYRRRPGEPQLSIAELRERMENPRTYEAERQAVVRLLRTLQAAGVALELSQPHKPGAAAEWDPARRTLRIESSVPEKGTLDFARVLNHEAIHVAQSCRGGGLRAGPIPLGLSRQLSAVRARELSSPIYAGAGPLEKVLEAEAYANQDNLAIGDALVRRHCRLSD